MTNTARILTSHWLTLCGVTESDSAKPDSTESNLFFILNISEKLRPNRWFFKKFVTYLFDNLKLITTLWSPSLRWPTLCGVVLFPGTTILITVELVWSNRLDNSARSFASKLFVFADLSLLWNKKLNLQEKINLHQHFLLAFLKLLKISTPRTFTLSGNFVDLWENKFFSKNSFTC